MKRNFRLTGSTDFKRVRRSGKSYAHPLLVLVVLPSGDKQSRFGVIAGRAVGKAVQRNRAKRMLREALRMLLPAIKPGWNGILIARKPILTAGFTDLEDGLRQIFSRAELLIENHGS